MKSILTTTRQTDEICFNLTLVRHAETNANAEGIIQGSMDTELSPIGYLQSKALGRYLQFQHFSHIFSSDLKRASETTRQIHLVNRVSSCDIQFDRLLRERIYGIAQGRTRQWLHELAEKNDVPYSDFTPPGAETTVQVRERAIIFFRQLCQELLNQFHAKKNPSFSHSISLENLRFNSEISFQRSFSTGNLHPTFTRTTIPRNSCQSSIDSALDLTSLSSDQQSTSLSSILSRNSSFEKQRYSIKNSCYSSAENRFSHLHVLIVSHGAVIRELIKYFACDLRTDIGKYSDTIQELPPNTSITSFRVRYSLNEQSIPTTILQLIDYHKKSHLINDEFNLNVTNKCSL